MSNHSNERGTTPTSPRKAIRGHNSTYLSDVQKRATPSSTKPTGKGSDTEEVVGSGSAPVDPMKETREPELGLGHYKPNKG